MRVIEFRRKKKSSKETFSSNVFLTNIAPQQYIQHPSKSCKESQRYRFKESELLRFQVARTEGRALVYKWPLPRRPRCFLPADVNPRSSLCLWTGLTIQLIRGSLRITECAVSIKITSKYLYVESYKHPIKGCKWWKVITVNIHMCGIAEKST